MLNKQTDNGHTSRKYEQAKKITLERLKANGENRSFDWFDLRFETRIMLEDFSYHAQIHDWVWIYFYLKEENAWDIILELTKVDFFLDFFVFIYCISRDVMQSNFPADKYWFS